MNSTKKKITINAASAVIQVCITAIIYFLLYRYLLTTLGVKQLGVWSLILSFSSIANLANMGLTSGLVKFVAEYLALNQKDKLGKLIFTSFISMAVLFMVLSVIILFFAKYFLHFVIEPQYLSVGLAMLPYSLGSLSINAMAGVFTSVLEGYQKNYLRNGIYIFSGLLMLVATIVLTPHFKLIGVAMAQLLQAFFILFAAFVLISKVDHYNRFLHWRWSNTSFKELFNYGYKFQIVSISQLFYEPTTKFLLSKFGGLAMVGYFEMANRLVSQIRALIVNANQVVVPVLAGANKINNTVHVSSFFVRMSKVVLAITFPVFTLLIIASPIISKLWIGDVEKNFVFATILISISAVFNIISGPSYFSCLAEGKLGIPIRSHLMVSILNISLGFLGFFWGGITVILAFCFSNIIGSLLTIYLYQKKSPEIDYSKIIEKVEWKIIQFSIIFISIFILYNLSVDYYPVLSSIILLGGAIIFYLYIVIVFKNKIINSMQNVL